MRSHDAMVCPSTMVAEAGAHCTAMGPPGAAGLSMPGRLCTMWSACTSNAWITRSAALSFSFATGSSPKVRTTIPAHACRQVEPGYCASMSMKLTRAAYQQLIDEDVAALLAGMPPSLERTHIVHVLKDSVWLHYPHADRAPDPGLLVEAHPCAVRCWRVGAAVEVERGSTCPECGMPWPVWPAMGGDRA